MGGTGLAADVPSGKPYGRIFTATGNGTFDATAPNYSNAMDYGDSIVKLDLNDGVPTMYANGTVVGDDFTPHDQANMDNEDQDVASGYGARPPIGTEMSIFGARATISKRSRSPTGHFQPIRRLHPLRAQRPTVRRQLSQPMVQRTGSSGA